MPNHDGPLRFFLGGFFYFLITFIGALLANTYQTYAGDGSNRNFSVTFPYLDKSHVRLYVNEVETAMFAWLTSAVVQTSVAPAVGAVVRVARVTPTGVMPVDFTDGSVLAEAELDLISKYAAYLTEETRNLADRSLSLNYRDEMDARGKRITRVGLGVQPTDAVNKYQLDTTAKTLQTSIDVIAGAESQAVQAAQEALTTKNAINDIYYGARSTQPITKPSGSAMAVGDEYFDTVVSRKKTFNGTAWVLTEDVVTTAAIAAVNQSVANFQASAITILGGLGYQVPVAYVSGLQMTVATQTVGYSGQTYAPILSALPFTTSGTFEVAKFRLIQGVAAVDLAGPGGVLLVGNAADKRDLADKSDAAKGPALLGHNATLNYAMGTIGAIFNDVIVNPKMFPWLAKFDGVSDDRPALVACMTAMSAAGGAKILLPRGVGLIGSAFAIPANIILSGQGKGATTLKRGFMGDMVTSFGANSGLEYLTIDGDTATRVAGRGVIFSGVSFGAFMLLAEIKDFVQSCLEFGTDAGSTFRAIGCTFFTTGAVGVVAAVKFAGLDTAATSRHFYNCESGGCTLYDFSGCNDLYISGGYTNGLIAGATTNKALVNNLRIGGAAGTVTLAGASCRYESCVFAVPVIFNCTNSHFNCEVPDQNITDNGTGNEIFTRSSNYAATWTGSTTNPVIGNGGFQARHKRTGDRITVVIDMTMGSTTTYGSGSWAFSLPKLDDAFIINVNGGGFAQVGLGNAYQFTTRTVGTQKAELFYVEGGVLKNIRHDTRAWAAGDTVRFSFEYQCV